MLEGAMTDFVHNAGSLSCILLCWFQAREYREDEESVDSQGSVSMSNVSVNYGGPYDNDAYVQSVAASRVSHLYIIFIFIFKLF
jgi:hypothetical protein